MADDAKALYLEADEDITSAIDKLNRALGEKVLIVVPKHSTLLQSIINLRLLKKAAADAGKELVLVTTDRTATNLASRVGLATASSLTAKPLLVESKQAEPDSGAEIDEDEIDTAPPEAAAAIAAIPHGETEAAAAGPVKPTGAPEPAVEESAVASTKPAFKRRPVGEETPEAEVPAVAVAGIGGGRRVPDFNSLQKRLLWGGAAIVLLILLFVLQFFLTHATVTLYAQGNKVNVSLPFHVDPGATASDAAKAVIVGQKLSSSKVLTATATATGTKDVGTKAGGSMTISNCDGNPHTFPTGTKFQSPGGLIFVSTADVTVPAGSLFFGSCSPGKASVAVTAEAAGDQYNLAPARYNIVGLPANQQASIYGNGNQMSGGTTKTVTVLTQVDVDKARDAALAADKDAAQKDLESKVNNGYKALGDSFNPGVTAVSANSAVDAQATQSTVSVTVDYSELAANSNDLKAWLDQQEQKQIGNNNQLYDDGFSVAKFIGKAGLGDFTVTTVAYDGQRIDTAAVAKQVTGKRYGDAIDVVNKLPGVQRAEVSIWPGFEANLPHVTNHITIQIKVAPNGG